MNAVGSSITKFMESGDPVHGEAANKIMQTAGPWIKYLKELKAIGASNRYTGARRVRFPSASAGSFQRNHF